MERELPDGVIDAAPPGGRDPVGDAESTERDAAARGSAELAADHSPPDDPAAGEAVRQGADPDLATDDQTDDEGSGS